jgi:undecaprenyl diphosphate synthase
MLAATLAQSERATHVRRTLVRQGAKPRAARYVAIIADGNGRWAHARGLPVRAGHEAGADTLKARIGDLAELGVRELTVYFFSTENWSRPAAEVQGLFSMLGERIARETPDLYRAGVRMRFIGGRREVQPDLLQGMRWAEELTAANDRITLFIAINYGGRAEIIDAAARFTGHTEEEFRACLYAPDMREPELIIRTGGERRLSNFLLWQTAHSELVFRSELWPDFTRHCLQQAMAEYARRGQRRLGDRVGHKGRHPTQHRLSRRGYTALSNDSEG